MEAIDGVKSTIQPLCSCMERYETETRDRDH